LRLHSTSCRAGGHYFEGYKTPADHIFYSTGKIWRRFPGMDNRRTEGNLKHLPGLSGGSFSEHSKFFLLSGGTGPTRIPTIRNGPSELAP
jgi:hypothetical protein